MEKPFWEKTYSDLSVATFGKKPANDILKISSSLKKGMTVLDIGCGEGRNSIYLAGLGHKVDAFDISEAGINKLKRIAEENKVEVNAWVQDLITFKFSKTYDLIISHGVFHLVEKHDWQRIINDMKDNTNHGGLNIVGIFTNKLPATPDNAPFTKALFEEGELKELYTDWNIIEFKFPLFRSGPYVTGASQPSVPVLPVTSLFRSGCFVSYHQQVFLYSVNKYFNMSVIVIVLLHLLLNAHVFYITGDKR